MGSLIKSNALQDIGICKFGAANKDVRHTQHSCVPVVHLIDQKQSHILGQ